MTEMSRKKLYEVERLSQFILSITKSFQKRNNDITIIDVGAGQGYLTHVLSLHHPCIALDFDTIQTSGAENRLKQRKITTANVTHKTIHISAESLCALLKELEQEKGPDHVFVLVGLHSCGDLSSRAMIYPFMNTESCKALIVVPCCFNLLTEKGVEEEPAVPSTTASNTKVGSNIEIGPETYGNHISFLHSTRSLKSTKITFYRFPTKSANSKTF
jgi:hypothetical protein